LQIKLIKVFNSFIKFKDVFIIIQITKFNDQRHSQTSDTPASFALDSNVDDSQKKPSDELFWLVDEAMKSLQRALLQSDSFSAIKQHDTRSTQT
jgi:hypothetical protein